VSAPQFQEGQPAATGDSVINDNIIQWAGWGVGVSVFKKDYLPTAPQPVKIVEVLLSSLVVIYPLYDLLTSLLQGVNC